MKLGRYRHYKGNDYIVIGVARHSETQEELVVYQQDYGEKGLVGSSERKCFWKQLKWMESR